MPRRPLSSPVLAGLLVALGGVACDDYILPGTEVETDRLDTIAGLSADTTAGEALFTEHCQVCHDPAGLEKRAGPAIAPYLADHEPRDVYTVILEGVGSMPSFDFTDQETADVTAWLFETMDGTGDDSGDTATDDTTDTATDDTTDTATDAALSLTGDATAGETTFDARCESCHNADGSAKIGPSLAAWMDAEDDATTLATIRQGVPGGLMPAYDGTLTDQQLADLLAFLRGAW